MFSAFLNFIVICTCIKECSENVYILPKGSMCYQISILCDKICTRIFMFIKLI